MDKIHRTNSETDIDIDSANPLRNQDKVARVPVKFAPTPRKYQLPKPKWIKAKFSGTPKVLELKTVLRENTLHTVCEEANCPNLGECFGNPSSLHREGKAANEALEIARHSLLRSLGADGFRLAFCGGGTAAWAVSEIFWAWGAAVLRSFVLRKAWGRASSLRSNWLTWEASACKAAGLEKCILFI